MSSLDVDFGSRLDDIAWLHTVIASIRPKLWENRTTSIDVLIGISP